MLIHGFELSARPGVTGDERAAVMALRAMLPWLLGMDLIALSALAYGVLDWAVGRPLRGLESGVEALSKLDLAVGFESGGGPLLSRVQSSLRRMAEALAEERTLTRRQLMELQDINRRLSAAQTQMLASERLATMGSLAAGIAHEVGNPLSGILGYLSVIRTRTSAPEVVECVTFSEGEVSRINHLVRGLLDVGRPTELVPTAVEVGPVLQTCLKVVSKGEDFHQVELDVELAPGLIIMGQPGPLSQIVINVLLNAAQAMNGKGKIFVRGVREAQTVRLELSDTGPGIPADVLPTLFEPFVTTKPAGKGTGMGLAVSRHLAEAMKGRLWAENRLEGGARFVLELPGTETPWRT